MRQPWFIQIYKKIEKYIELKIPFEIVYFPSTGITSALNRYAEQAKNDPNATRKYFIIDFRIANFNKDAETNKEEFFRILKSHLEHSLEGELNVTTEKNIYQNLKEAFNKYLEKNQKILLVFHTFSQINLNKVPEFKDFLIFLDQLRDVNKGNINILLTSTTEQFNDQNPAPIPMITKFNNYYDLSLLYRTINEDILKDEFHFKKITSDDVLKLIEISGGNVAIVKALARDFTLQGLKINFVHKIRFDNDFFDVFINCKLAVDRIKQQLDSEIINTVMKISTGQKLNDKDQKGFIYLQQTGVLNEQGKIRSPILINYWNRFCQLNKQDEQITPVVPEVTIKPTNLIKEEPTLPVAEQDDTEYLELNSHIKVQPISGEIRIANKPTSNYLTEKELQVFLLLYKSANKEIGRELIANTIWTGPEATEYSDWAIDKLISRIREKLTDTKPYKFIKTLRKKGFILIK